MCTAATDYWHMLKSNYTLKHKFQTQRTSGLQEMVQPHNRCY